VRAIEDVLDRVQWIEPRRPRILKVSYKTLLNKIVALRIDTAVQ
jgi:hypothetical protein